MKGWTTSLGLIALVALSGCASGPQYAEMKGSLPELNAESGRVLIYRPLMTGPGVQPAVLMNGEKIGRSKPGSFFFVDRPPGEYEISASTEATHMVGIVLEKGQTLYVRTDVSMGAFVGTIHPRLVEASIAETEIQHCFWSGQPPATP